MGASGANPATAQAMNALPAATDGHQLLGQILVARGAVRAADLERTLELQRSVEGRIGSLLIRTGALSEDQLLDALSDQLGLPISRSCCGRMSRAWLGAQAGIHLHRLCRKRSPIFTRSAGSAWHWRPGR